MRKFINIINEASTRHEGDRSILSHIAAEQPEVEETANLPATINHALANGDENHFTPEWRKVVDLPHPFDLAVRAMGPMVFSLFTTTPVDEIEMMADILNDPADVKDMMSWIAHEGQRIDTQVVLPGHLAQADCMTYRVRGFDFLLVRDALGHYIYAWPTNDSKIGGHDNNALPAPPRRLR